MDQTGRRVVRVGRLRVFVFGFVARTGSAKPAFVVALVERVVAFRRFRFRHAAPQLTDTFVVKRLCGAHEDVETTVRGVEAKGGGHPLEITNDVISLFFRGAIISLGGALDVDAVLVGSGEKEGFNSLLSFLTSDRVRHNHRVEMPEVWQAVGVIDRCGDVESFHRLVVKFV